MKFKDLKFSELDDEMFNDVMDEEEMIVFQDADGNTIEYPVDYLDGEVMDRLIEDAEKNEIKNLNDITDAIKRIKDEDLSSNN